MNDKRDPGRVAIVNSLPPPIEDNLVGCAMVVSIGLAQFLTEVDMTEHARFDRTDKGHAELLEEFEGLKREIQAEIQPLVEMVGLMEVLGEIIEEVQNAEEKSPSPEAATSEGSG